MKIAIRVDASSQMGVGHFMRCLTLADALTKHAAEIRFVSRHMPRYLQDMLAVKGHGFAPISGQLDEGAAEGLAHSHWLGTSQSEDATNTIDALSDQSWDYLLVDHYGLDARWESALRRTAKRILVIDDIADRLHDCDFLLDQNLYADMNVRYLGKVPSHCRLLLGPSYVLLRDEFRQLRKQIKPRIGEVKRMLVFFGGMDANNYTSVAIEALRNIEHRDFQIDIVIGAQHPLRAEIESACADSGFACHVQTNRMAELMAAADLAIGAAGSASWERCCLGLPALLVSLADNQVDIAKGLDLYGACIYVGTQETAGLSVMSNAIKNVLKHQGKLAAYSEKAYSLVDGLGTDRLCRELIG